MLDHIYQALDPVALSIGSLEIRWYSLAYIAGFVWVAVNMWCLAKRW